VGAKRTNATHDRFSHLLWCAAPNRNLLIPEGKLADAGSLRRASRGGDENEQRVNKQSLQQKYFS
jgi:hypothetical protein